MYNSSNYFRTILDTKVSIFANQIDDKIDEHILDNLEKKVTNRVISNGIVIRVLKLIEYKNGLVTTFNFTTSVNYEVKYECILCVPVKHNEIIAKVQRMVPELLYLQNGPIQITVRTNSIDKTNFTINENSIMYNNTGKIIEPDQFLKLSIVDVSMRLNETDIYCIAKLLDVASAEEIERYNREMALISGNEENNDRFI